MKLEKNTTISHYKILSEIGKGGMGEVYLAQDTKLNRKVAIKFLNEKFGKDLDKLNRFIQEAQATSALNHPNILTVYGIDSFDDTHYIATEFIEGGTLREVVSEKDSIPLNEILKIGIQTAEALSAAHEAGIAHRDIKPENIMIRKDGYVKVLDFGLAKLTEKSKTEDDISLEGETKALVETTPGLVMGTVSYMSPEQARGKGTDERTDIWSLGVVLYEMLSGKLPFTGETINHTIVAILEKEPKLLENVPDELQRIIRKTLTKDKDSRYQTARDLVIDLKNLRRELDLQGELERSIIPNRDTETGIENKTALYGNTSIEDTAPDQRSVTQNITTSSSLEYAVTQAKSHKLLFSLIGIVLIGVLSLVGYFAFFATSGSDAIKSIAVMPFVNESGNEDVEYLSDGMTETLIASLTEIPSLSVKASSTVFYYKGKNKTPKEIGTELGVEAVLLGKLIQRNDNLTVRLELVDTSTLDAIWSQSYDRKMSDLVNLQSEIARNVSDKLRLKLTTAVQEKVTKSDTANSKARELYLKGIYHLNKRAGQNGDQELAQAAGLFKQAIEQDPDYAIAYTGLADSYTLMPFWGPYRSKEYLPKAKEAALKALDLNKDLAQAYASLGNILLAEYDWDEAEREYKKAIELDPKYANAYKWYGDLLSTKGMFEEGLQQYDKALELDPFNLSTLDTKARTLAAAGRFDEAIRQSKKIIELVPEQGNTYFLLSSIYRKKEMERDAIEQWMIGIEKIGFTPEEIRLQEENYKKGGFAGLTRARLERRLASIRSILEKDKNAVIQYVGVAKDYGDLKDKEKTLEFLNKAYEDRDPSLTELKRSQQFRFLKDEPEFQELIEKIGIPNS